jgi:hypothetical protein
MHLESDAPDRHTDGVGVIIHSYYCMSTWLIAQEYDNQSVSEAKQHFCVAKQQMNLAPEGVRA